MLVIIYLRRRKRRRKPRRRKSKRALMDPSINGGTDSISSMPDEILHHILSFLPIKPVIRTSFFSRRWRHVWCETPCLNFDCLKATPQDIMQTLKSYRATKIMSFHLTIPPHVPEPQIDEWMEFAVSRNVEKLSLFFHPSRKTYRFPDSFYRSSSLEQLSLNLYTIPGCTVSWKSLRILTLLDCGLRDNEPMANILSGSPVLETLRLGECFVERLDLSKSPSLRRLEIHPLFQRGRRPAEIVAPQIHYLRLAFSCEEPPTLVDVSSLAEASLYIRMGNYKYDPFRHGVLPTMVLEMLAKLQNVERLTFGGTLLQILSLAELCGLPFPTLKVQTLTVGTMFARSAIPGIARLLQNSPGLKKLRAHGTYAGRIKDTDMDIYLDSQGLHPEQCWRPKYEVFPTTYELNRMLKSCCKDAASKVVASFMEMLLRNGKTLETLVLGFKDIYELLQIPSTLCSNNNVSIVLKRYKYPVVVVLEGLVWKLGYKYPVERDVLRKPRGRKSKRALMDPSINGGTDIISCMPDEILHHILSFLPINLVIRTSFFSRRWRHVWCETPRLDFDCLDFDCRGREATAQDINQTLKSYRAPKITSLNISMPQRVPEPQVDKWVEFAISRNVEKLSLLFFGRSVSHEAYRFPESFYRSSSLEQLSLDFDMIPICTVSWKSLREVTLWDCGLHDESMAKILSGSPLLETLILGGCFVERLDLSKSSSLRRLESHPSICEDQGPAEIVAPQIHYMSLSFSYKEPPTLVDVSSLAEASLGIRIDGYGFLIKAGFLRKAGSLPAMVLEMLAKLQNVEKLTLGGTLLQILSLAELCGLPFPTLKVKTLTVETTMFVRSVIPGIARLLQNSPGLKKLITHGTYSRSIQDTDMDSYLDSQGLHPDQCWRPKYEKFPTTYEFSAMLKSCCKDAASKVVASFMEMLLRNGKTLETFVVKLEYVDEFDDVPKWFEELLQIPPTLCNNNDVSIVLRRPTFFIIYIPMCGREKDKSLLGTKRHEQYGGFFILFKRIRKMIGDRDVRRHRRKRLKKSRRRKSKRALMDPSINGGTDIISSMPDEILHHILSFLRIKPRHVWCETPCLDFGCLEATPQDIMQTLKSYRATKIMSFYLRIPQHVPEPQIDKWMEFDISRNVEKLSLFFDCSHKTYRFPDSFYCSSSLEQLSLDYDTIPRCTVSWKSLRKLTLWSCRLHEDESMANILSGSPLLETLILSGCFVERLDLSKSSSLRRLEIHPLFWEDQGPAEIVAPQIHYLSLAFSYKEPPTLVDVSSLIEVHIRIRMSSYGFLETMVLEMLPKLQNVERLNCEGTLLQILSAAELRGVAFPTLKVKTLTVETMYLCKICYSWYSKNSPGLKKLVVIVTHSGNIEDRYIDSYLESQGLSPDQCWRSKYEVFPTTDEFRKMLYRCEDMSKVVASFMEMALRNGNTLETLDVGFNDIYDCDGPIEKLNQIPPTLCNNNNVSIVLKRYSTF
ncbi:unnamed protein product [Thlaspi arvense]|uniref:F-box domain-containing protein n=1 Tax=Thlaspi arvense TaxID=13288 RepID=A0AAU9RTX3_THLAR|nr:unnamed protein product [Thlaspi arvense]